MWGRRRIKNHRSVFSKTQDSKSNMGKCQNWYQYKQTIFCVDKSCVDFGNRVSCKCLIYDKNVSNILLVYLYIYTCSILSYIMQSCILQYWVDVLIKCDTQIVNNLFQFNDYVSRIYCDFEVWWKRYFTQLTNGYERSFHI